MNNNIKIIAIMFLFMIVFPIKVIYSLTNDDFGVDTVIMIGDSYAAALNPDFNSPETGEFDIANSWITQTVNKTKLASGNSSSYIINKNVNCSIKFAPYKICAESGAGIAKNGDYGNDFVSILNIAIDKVTDKNKVYWVIVHGGYNDTPLSQSQILESGREFMSIVRKKLPNAQVAFGVPGYHRDGERNSTVDNVIIPLFKQIASEYGALYIGDTILRPDKNQYTSDHIHINAAAEERIANATVEFMAENTLNIVYHRNTNSSDTTTVRETYLTGLNNTIDSNSFTRSGYVLKGWSTSAGSSVIAFEPNSVISDNYIKSNTVVHLYAVWNRTSSNIEVSSDLKKDDNKLLIKVNTPSMNMQTFMGKIQTNATISLYDKDNNTITSRTTVKTGDKIEVRENSDTINYTILVVGDVNSDSSINKQDTTILSKYIINKTSNINTTYLYAGDMNDDGKIKMNDVMRHLNQLRRN